MKIQGSVAFVTGANRGLGLAFAREGETEPVHGTARLFKSAADSMILVGAIDPEPNP
jgi:NADP-dependent 3-hydroxy acid dehydrogenase YdfG